MHRRSLSLLRSSPLTLSAYPNNSNNTSFSLAIPFGWSSWCIFLLHFSMFCLYRSFLRSEREECSMRYYPIVWCSMFGCLLFSFVSYFCCKSLLFNRSACSGNKSNAKFIRLADKCSSTTTTTTKTALMAKWTQKNLYTASTHSRNCTIRRIANNRGEKKITDYYCRVFFFHCIVLHL